MNKLLWILAILSMPALAQEPVLEPRLNISPAVDPATQAMMDAIDQQAKAQAALAASRKKMQLLKQSQGGMNQWDALVLMAQSTSDCVAESAKDKKWYTRIATIKSACGGTQEAYIMAVCTQVVQDTGDARDLNHCTQLMASIKSGNKEMAMAAIQWGGRILMAGTLGHYAGPIIADALAASRDKWNTSIGAASKDPAVIEVPTFIPPTEVIE